MSTNIDLTPLREACFVFPSIDNHAHNISRKEHSLDQPIIGITSEALGQALDDAAHTLPHIRARNMLIKLYGLSENATWEELTATREKMDYEEMCELNFKPTGIQCLLLDDGLDGSVTTCNSYRWHDRFTSSPTKRILRIETMAQQVITRILKKEGVDLNFSVLIKDGIEQAVREAVADPDIVGFKSIAAYRTGLDIQAHSNNPDDPIRGFGPLLIRWQSSEPIRINRENKEFEDWLIRTVMRLIENKPIQFHTGLGDTDMLLIKSDPSLLQPLVEAFPDCRIVLLHSSYPYTRQAGYLASCYKNVYLDFGEVFPLVAAHGQHDIIRQLFELTPTTKLLWSTDAHHHPEMYYCSSLQSREALCKVISDFVARGELSVNEAIAAVENMLFHNSNRVYNLNLKPIPTNIATPPAPRSAKLTLHRLANSGVRHVRVSWLDYTNNLRFRLIPTARFVQLASSRAPGVNLTMATLGLNSHDMMAPGFSGTGEHLYVFDLSTLQRIPKSIADGHASVMGYFESKDRSLPAHQLRDPRCPRGFLQRIVQDALQKHGISFLIGFETEFIILETLTPPTTASVGAWSTSLAHRTGLLAHDISEEIADTITKAGIELQMFHAESAPGQYEIVTGPLPPLEAVDALVLTRDIIYNICAKNGLKATLVPKPYLNADVPYAASATHMHISCTSSPKAPPSNHPDVPDLPTDFASFMSGMLEHHPSFCAFTLSTPPSYERVADGAWSGGTWVSWGRDNREAPLRLCGGYNGDGFNVELKSLDGMANPYLAIGSVLAAGLTGVATKAPLRMRSSFGIVDAAGEEKRKEWGIAKRVPKTWEEAKKNLLADEVLVDTIGQEVVDAWVNIKQFEIEYVKGLKDPHTFWLQYF